MNFIDDSNDNNLEIELNSRTNFRNFFMIQRSASEMISHPYHIHTHTHTQSPKQIGKVHGPKIKFSNYFETTLFIYISLDKLINFLPIRSYINFLSQFSIISYVKKSKIFTSIERPRLP